MDATGDCWVVAEGLVGGKKPAGHVPCSCGPSRKSTSPLLYIVYILYIHYEISYI
jgi:hypothetical protein